MTTPATAAAAAESVEVPPGRGERFSGFGVMGLPFASGHVLAMRRFPASSIGPAYTSVWHRDPGGRWSFWQDQADQQSCPRYFSSVVSETRTVPVELDWPDEHTLRLAVPDVGLTWTSRLHATPVTRAFSALGGVLPDRVWHSRPVLAAMSSVAGTALRAGTVSLTGRTPNGQDFTANPLRMWVVDEADARLGDVDLGPVGPLDEQVRLGDFWIPQRGVFSIGRISFAP